MSLYYNKFIKTLKFALCLLFAAPLLYSQETVTTAAGETTGSVKTSTGEIAVYKNANNALKAALNYEKQNLIYKYQNNIPVLSKKSGRNRKAK